jgi:hypothetical protein
MRTRRGALVWRDVSTGFALIGIVTAVSLSVFFLDEIRRAFEEGPRLVAISESAPELVPGSIVWVAGRPAGRVLSVAFREPRGPGSGNIVIEAVLRRSVGDVMRRNATARIQPSDLLEPVVLAIDPGSPEQPPFDFADTLVTIAANLELERLLAQLDSLRVDTDRRVSRAGQLRRVMLEGPGSAAALRRDRTLRSSLEERRQEFLDLRPGDTGGGAIGALLRDTTLAARLDSTRARLSRFEITRDSLIRGGAIGSEDVSDALTSLGESLRLLDEDLQAGYGTVGRVLYDDAVSRQVDRLRTRIDTVFAELLANPRRWLRVRIF